MNDFYNLCCCPLKIKLGDFQNLCIIISMESLLKVFRIKGCETDLSLAEMCSKIVLKDLLKENKGCIRTVQFHCRMQLTCLHGLLRFVTLVPWSFCCQFSQLLLHTCVRKTLFTFVPECSKNIVYVRSRTFERH